MRLKLTSIMNSILVYSVYLRKTLYFLVFHGNIGLKTSTYEFTDRIYQNKQGFEGKKLSGNNSSRLFEQYQRVCVVDNVGDSYYFLTWAFAFILLVILQNPSK